MTTREAGTTENILNSTLTTIINTSTSANDTSTSSVDIYYDPLPCYSLYCIFELRYRQEYYTILMCISIMLGILGTVGFMGNSLVLIVLLKAKMKQTSIYFMLMLCILDLIACAVVIPGIVVTEWHFPFTSDFLCKLWEGVRFFTIPTSAMVLVAIAFERCVVICFAPRRVSKNMTFLIILVIFIFGACLGVPPALGMGVYSGNGFYLGYCITNYQYLSLDSLTKYWLGITSIFILMIISIIIFYSSIFFTVLIQNRKWNKIRSQQTQPATCKMAENCRELRRKSSTSDIMFATRASEKLLKIPKNQKLSEITTPIENFELPSGDYPDTQIENIGEENDPFTDPSEEMSKYGSQTVEKPMKIQNVKISPGTLHDNKTETNANSIPSTSRSTNSTDPFTNSTDTNSIKQKSSSVENLVKKQSLRIMPTIPDDQKVDTKTNSMPSTSQNLTNKVPIRNPAIKTSRKMHIKTTQVLFTVTMVYIVSFLPTFLIANNLLPEFKGSRVIYLMYFLNNTANPIIYSFMNPQFRKEVWKFLKCKSR